MIEKIEYNLNFSKYILMGRREEEGIRRREREKGGREVEKIGKRENERVMKE